MKVSESIWNALAENADPGLVIDTVHVAKFPQSTVIAYECNLGKRREWRVAIYKEGKIHQDILVEAR